MKSGATSFSQYGQDRYVIDTLLGGKRAGVFMEIGAFDGRTLSNTYLLERDYDWRGICIEALPEQFAKLTKNRSCICVHGAAAQTGGQMLRFNALSGDTAMLSGRPDHFSAAHARRAAADQQKLGTTSEIIEVVSVRPADLLRQHAMTRVDFVSIDIEGGELDGLAGLLDSDIHVGVLSVENKNGDPAVHDFLRQRGYLRLTRLGPDDVYRLAEECSPADRRAARLYGLRHWKHALKAVGHRMRPR